MKSVVLSLRLALVLCCDINRDAVVVDHDAVVFVEQSIRAGRERGASGRCVRGRRDGASSRPIRGIAESPKVREIR